jgi:hypothetical protein
MDFFELNVSEKAMEIASALEFYPTLKPYFAAWVCRSFHSVVVLELDEPAPLSAGRALKTAILAKHGVAIAGVFGLGSMGAVVCG